MTFISCKDLNKTDESINAWERIGGITLSNIFHSSWERGRVNLLFSPNIGCMGCELSYGTCHISLCAL